MAVAVAVAVAVSEGGAVAVAGFTKRSFNHIQKECLISVWVFFALVFFRRRRVKGNAVAVQLSRGESISSPGATFLFYFRDFLFVFI